ncbi:RAMP superfamily protein [Almyronema epifaneia]|uniref:RAMP superfamily protein n=1 Tax=Almyronema epifaneia S1 TaxID=2991925 RepID=A0ABW6IK79_9CYAN
MKTIRDAARKVPLMFRAQVAGRCQLQRIRDLRYEDAEEQDAERWTDEWVIKAYPEAPDFGDDVQTRSYNFSWRFVTNGGQDDGVIRPVIGAKGWPFYPGSSMKGLFRQACDLDQADRYCGRSRSSNDYEPGILRFHGGYPIDSRWTEQLLDIIHPQQERQVKASGKSSAFVQISLYQPALKFGISSTLPLSEDEWQTIWQIWEKAIASGLGCRVSAGYGQPEIATRDPLYRTQIQGQGQAAKLIDGTGEFRPNIFRAAVRGHALRIFGGLTDSDTAEQIVEQLFGGISQGQGTFGLLSMAFEAIDLDLDVFRQSRYEEPIYEVEGQLLWSLTQPLADDAKTALTKLIEALTRFAMVLGGFGKSWRRADHRLVYPDYYGETHKPLIGCHWQWSSKRSQVRDVRIRKLEQVGEFIEEVRQAARDWMTLYGHPIRENRPANWREAWHSNNVQVWGRLAEHGIEDCEAVHWLHGSYRSAIPSVGISEGSIYQSSITGQMGQIGRLWHRMYPYIRLVKDPQNPKRPLPKQTQQYFELLTLFPDDSLKSINFLDFLVNQQTLFQKLWP